MLCHAFSAVASNYVGHFMAWLAAAMLFAFQLHETHLTDSQVSLLMETGKYDREFLEETPLTPELLTEVMKIEEEKFGEFRSKTPTPLPGRGLDGDGDDRLGWYRRMEPIGFGRPLELTNST